MVDGPFHLIWVGRGVERLDGQAEVIAHDVGWRTVDPGHLGAHPAPLRTAGDLVALLLEDQHVVAVLDDMGHPQAHQLAELHVAWADQPLRVRERIHIANVPTADVDENAIVVNALQRRADVVVQKSIAEGFGLTVTEAMWKRRPIVAGGVGGVLEQIDDGVQGLLVDPQDLTAFGGAVRSLLADPVRAAALGEAARERVSERFLPPQYLAANLELVAAVAGGGLSSP